MTEGVKHTDSRLLGLDVALREQNPSSRLCLTQWRGNPTEPLKSSVSTSCCSISALLSLWLLSNKRWNNCNTRCHFSTKEQFIMSQSLMCSACLYLMKN